ncbi:hypothetical protein [Nocardia sp. NPDC047038]
MTTLRHLHQLERAGILPDPDKAALHRRWLFYGLLGFFVFFALLIIF